MKKAMLLVAFYHLLCLILALLGEFMMNGPMLQSGFFADMAGAILCPIALAVAAWITSIKSETSLLKFYPGAAALTGGIGLVRGLVYSFSGGFSNINLSIVLSRFKGAMLILVISFILLTVWFLIFEMTRFLMNRPTKYNRLNKKSK